MYVHPGLLRGPHKDLNLSNHLTPHVPHHLNHTLPRPKNLKTRPRKQRLPPPRDRAP